MREFHPRGLVLGSALLASVACSPQEAGHDEPSIGSSAAESQPQDGTAPLPQEGATEPPIASERSRPELGALLRLPPGAGAVDRVAERLKSREEEADPSPPKEARVRLEAGQELEDRGLHKRRNRREVGAAVDVGKSTTIRGGVLVEGEPGREPEDPTPRVGVEVRF